MNSKKFLALLVSIFLYINVYVPLSESNTKDISKLTLYEEKLKKEKYFLENRSKLVEFVSQSKKGLDKNSNLMYPATLQNAIVFNRMQTKVKHLASKYQAKVVNVLWGEPYSEDDITYTIMPFTFILEIEPADASKYLNALLADSKAITIKKAFFVKKKNEIVMNVQVNLYKSGKQND